MSLELKQQTCASQAVRSKDFSDNAHFFIGFHQNTSSKMSAKFE